MMFQDLNDKYNVLHLTEGQTFLHTSAVIQLCLDVTFHIPVVAGLTRLITVMLMSASCSFA